MFLWNTLLISPKGECYACIQEKAYQHSPLKVQHRSHPHLPCQSLEDFPQYLRRLAVSAIQVLIEQVMCEELDESHRSVLGGMHAPSAVGNRNGSYTRDLVTPTGRIEALKVRRRSGRGVSQPGLRALPSKRPGGGRSADPDVCQWDKHAISVGEVAATLMGVAPSASAVSRLNQTLTEQYETWRERPLLPHYRILYAGRSSILRFGMGPKPIRPSS